MELVFIYQPAATFPATDLKQFYVSISRGRDAAHIYTDDVAELLSHVSQTGDRQSAIELLKRKNITRERADYLARQSLLIIPEDKTEAVNTQNKVRVQSYEPKPRLQL